MFLFFTNPNFFFLLSIIKFEQPSHTKGADNPTYLKHSGDKVYFGVAIAGVTFGVGCILNGLFNMSLGRNKIV